MKFSNKKLLAAVLAFVMLQTVSCSKQAEIADTSGVKRDPQAGVTVDTDVSFNAVYSRTDGYLEKKQYPYVTVINSRTEIERYTSENEGWYDFYSTFYDTVTQYDTAFFEKSSLIMILLEEPSGSYTHEVTDVEYDSSTGYTDVKISRSVPAEVTDDMAEWHIIVEIPKDSPILDYPDRITVEITNKKA